MSISERTRQIPHTTIAIASAAVLVAALVAVLATARASNAAVPQDAKVSGPAIGSRSVYFPQQGLANERAQRPKNLRIAGDGSLSVTNVSWLHWGNLRAVGRGTAMTNDCSPNCARGHFHRYPVLVRLASTHHSCGHWFYSRIELIYPHSRPAGIKPTDLFSSYRAYC